MRKRTYFVVGFTMLLAVASLVAGPLTPPVGPVTSTNKTLQEVEPRTAINLTNTPGDADSLFKITQPGSYYLTGNITGLAGRHGIEITTSGVTLDLMGFALSGSAEVPALDGVSTTVFSRTNITIRNGSVRGWGGEGVDLGTFGAFNSAVIDVHASGNTGNGIASGSGSTIAGCTASFNTGDGIVAGEGSTITGCTAFGNIGNGISASTGISITGCTAYNNTGSGITAGNGNMVAGCTASFNTGSGILAGSGSTITGCTASFNDGNGISASTGSTISNCTTRANALDGIRVSFSCVVLANTCSGNGGNGSGIHVTGSDNRIEGNNCINAGRGIDVDLAGNIIIKNTCSGNTFNWDVVAGNVCLVVQGVTGGAILGNTGGIAPGSTDPNANFSY